MPTMFHILFKWALTTNKLMSFLQKQCAALTTCEAVSSEAAHRLVFVPLLYKTKTANGY